VHPRPGTIRAATAAAVAMLASCVLAVGFVGAVACEVTFAVSKNKQQIF
jgi:hypothetical protein